LTQGKEEGQQKASKKKSNPDSLTNPNREIVSQLLINLDEEQQLIYCDRKSFHVYSEGDESSEKLRTVTGAHLSSITCIQFDYHLSLIATGAEGGEAGVWDYENSQLLGLCTGHSQESEITAISFLSPYPAMVTAASDNKIMIWTVRPIPIANAYV
jgi:WD40 repeat protein